MIPDFLTDHEKELSDSFLKKKYVIVPAESMSSLHAIRKKIATTAADLLGKSIQDDKEIDSFLNNIHHHVSGKELNDIRVKIIVEMNREPWFRKAYYDVARVALSMLAGNELVMQRRINLSIQLPNDDSSLLPVHADVWAGDSPYEIVLWIPLVDCYETKSMFIANADVDEQIQAKFKQFQGKSTEDLFNTIEKDVEFLRVPYGSVLLFSQNVMHGNRINRENTTRWSMNCRFKNILTPYHGKKLCEFFEPITIRPLTRVGMSYKLPEDFYEE